MAAKSSIGAAAGKSNKSAGKSSSKEKKAVTSLTDAQIAALEAVTGATLGELTNKKYPVSIPATKNISPASLEKAANLAIEIQGLASSKQLGELQEKVQKAVESGTISKALKILDKSIKPATKATLKI